VGEDRVGNPRGETPLDDLTRVLERIRGACLRLAATIVRDLSLAEEVVQESFLAAWQYAPDRYDPRRGSLESWVLTLTRHKAVDAVRHAEHVRRIQRLEEAEPRREHAAESLEDLVIRAADELRLRRHLDRLPAVQQRTLLLLYWYGLTQTEVSTREGTPLGTVKSRAATAIQRLRNSWPGEPPPPGSSCDEEIYPVDRSDFSRDPNVATEGKRPRGAPPPGAEDRLGRQETG
jgi:RNA polymerase sigma-70 factor (ECF subfamily)